MRVERTTRWASAVVLAAALTLAAPAGAATITVNTTSDVVANDGLCSLREALTAAATDTASGTAAGECPAGSGADTIVLGPHPYVLTLAGAGEDANATGDLDVTAGTVTITGAGPSSTSIDASGIDRVLDVLTGATLTLRDLTVTGGKAPDGGAGTAAAPGATGLAGGPGGESQGDPGSPGSGGGGIRNAGTLTLDDVTVTNNQAGNGGIGGAAGNGGDGGAGVATDGGGGGASDGGAGGVGGLGGGLLSTAGAVTISDSTFTANTSGGGGEGGATADGGTGGAGGAPNGDGGPGGDVFGGSGGNGGDGGAISVDGGTLMVSASTIAQNHTGPGGGGGAAGLAGPGGTGTGTGRGGNGGVAFPGNGGEGGPGGGIAVRGAALTLSDSTISDNHAGDGGGTHSTGAGGDGGAGGAGNGGGGFGGEEDAGEGGSGGLGGGLSMFFGMTVSSTVVLTDDTLAGNQAGTGAPGGDGIHGGVGGTGGGTGGAGPSGTSRGGGGGEGGEGGAAFLEGVFSITDVTATGNAGGGGGNGGSGGNGDGSVIAPGSSSGGEGGEGGIGGGLDGDNSDGALNHVTITGNSSGPGGSGGNAGTGTPATVGPNGEVGFGADVFAGFSTPSVTESASIIGVCGGPLDDGGGDIALPATTPCPGEVGDPGLGPLADNGGPTQTMALHAGSVAVDRVNAPCGTTPDQRGVARPQGAGCDAGAYELAPPDVSAGTASNLTSTGAVVSGQIVPNARPTTWHLEYGPTTAYGSQTADQTIPATTAATAVSVTLTGLTANTPFHYRLVASNLDGTTDGADGAFTTSPRVVAPPVVVSPRFAGVVLPKGPFTASAKGQIAITVSCPKPTPGSCVGTLTLTRKVKTKARGKHKAKVTTVTVSHAGFRIAPGAHQLVRLKLGAGAKAALLAAGKNGLAVTLVASARDSKGVTVKVSEATKLKGRKRPKPTKPKRP